MIKVKNLNISIDNVELVRNISFDLEQGDVVKIAHNKKFLRLLHAPTQKWSEALRQKLGM